VVGKLMEKGDFEWGYDAQTDQDVNMYKAGIVDPVKLVCTALQDAASVAGLIITTEAAAAERPKKESAGGPGGMPGGMGGMGDMDY
jgi:chaperonin GroEL